MTDYNNTIEILVEQFHNECEGDYLGLWAIVRDARNAFPGGDNAQLEATVLKLIRMLLARGAVFGQFDPRRAFVSQPMPNEDAIAAIAAAWRGLGRDPEIGEVGWFTSKQIYTEGSPYRLESQ